MSASISIGLSDTLEEVLKQTPRLEWKKSEAVAKAFLGDSRVKAMLAHVRRKLPFAEKIDKDDILQEVYLVLSEKLMTDLDEPKNVYSLLYRTIALTTMGIRSKDNKPLDFGLDTPDEAGGESLLDRLDLQAESTTFDITEAKNMQASRISFGSKIERLGWPQSIANEDVGYKRVGRPKKEDAVVEKIPLAA